MLGIFNSEEDHAPLSLPSDIGEIIQCKLKGRTAYIHGEAEDKAGYDIPTFIDGDMAQLDLPVNEQDILLMLPSGEYPCKAEYNDSIGSSDCYLITLKSEPSIKQ